LADIVTKAVRSRIMSSVKGRNTGPERVVRQICTGIGARYRLHRKDLPGSPDLVFSPRKLAIFVHGCFWHRHDGCKLASKPKSRVKFWNDKFAKNVTRDRAAIHALRRSGWRVEVVWECETRQKERLTRRIEVVLSATGP
jgi:DNA mismatch endonuclease (patch repair protein)